LCGCVSTNRAQAQFGFLNINDGSCLDNLQVVYNEILENFEEISKYRDFYASMIKTVFDDTALSSQTDSVQIAFEQLDLLSKKINKIKRNLP